MDVIEKAFWVRAIIKNHHSALMMSPGGMPPA